MAQSYLIPIVTWITPGFDCTIIMPNALIAQCMTPDRCAVERFWNFVCEGEVVAEGADTFTCEYGRVVGDVANDVIWRAAEYSNMSPNGGYLEFGIRTADGTRAFNQRHLPSVYNSYSKASQKSFFSCHTWKFGSPQVISQIAKFRRYIDCYPVVSLDLEKDIGESLVLMNPYQKAILVEIITSDERRLPKLRIPPMCARRFFLHEMILSPGETAWSGTLQITANNRVVTYMVKHSVADPALITTVEHLDPFRSDPTQFPLSRWLRLKYGERQAKAG